MEHVVERRTLSFSCECLCVYSVLVSGSLHCVLCFIVIKLCRTVFDDINRRGKVVVVGRYTPFKCCGVWNIHRNELSKIGEIKHIDICITVYTEYT